MKILKEMSNRDHDLGNALQGGGQFVPPLGMDSKWLAVIEVSEKIGQLKMLPPIVVFKNYTATEKKS